MSDGGGTVERVSGLLQVYCSLRRERRESCVGGPGAGRSLTWTRWTLDSGSGRQDRCTASCLDHKTQ